MLIFDQRYVTINPLASYASADSRMLRGESRIGHLRMASTDVHSKRTETGCVLFVSRFITHMNVTRKSQYKDVYWRTIFLSLIAV